jgi:hypothetical protein
MFELVALLLFVVLPFGLGYVTGSYAAAFLPTLSLLASLLNYGLNPPEGPPDEVDVLPIIWVVASAVAVTVCMVGAALGRRMRRRRAARAAGGGAG